MKKKKPSIDSSHKPLNCPCNILANSPGPNAMWENSISFPSLYNKKTLGQQQKIFCFIIALYLQKLKDITAHFRDRWVSHHQIQIVVVLLVLVILSRRNWTTQMR